MTNNERMGQDQALQHSPCMKSVLDNEHSHVHLHAGVKDISIAPDGISSPMKLDGPVMTPHGEALGPG